MQSLSSGAGPPKFDEMEPPAYDVAIKLPTYEEAQQEKIAEWISTGRTRPTRKIS